ncbi:M24 family metallopeptidase [Haloprofundus salinisoli]|uniref:M24 family metallopeptidase n=1 Tax=Haloprofundus salinisoli TaxID=2876193 RepID=UPI001CCB0C28|nr:Xaa-Pro peptidase family protein [Haloprofundus salinisoli]
MTDRYETRRSALFDELPESVETVYVAPSETLRYLSGLSMHQSERPTLLVLSRETEPAAVLPKLETDRVADALGDDVSFYTYGDATDPTRAASEAFDRLAEERELSGEAAVEFRSTRVLEYNLLTDYHDPASIRDLEPAAAALRARKDDSERESMRKAARIADRVLQETFEDIEVGMSERDVERAIEKRVIDSDADSYAGGIVTVGERTAFPHADTGHTKVEEGDLVMIDFYIRVDGYFSDITRTVAVGDPGEKCREVYEVVREAARAGREAVAEGVPYQNVDRAARRVIDDAGYGDYFPHRLGHGLGLEGHEPPYLVEGNEATLDVGDAFTVEPGVYVDGVGGVRVEDDVLLTEEGAEVLTETPRDLRIL